jgi:hypothetical protein
MGRLGPHPAFDQAAAYLAYSDGDFSRTDELLAALRAIGSPNARVLVLEVLSALGRGENAEAERLGERLSAATVLGERQALLAIVAQQRGDSETALTQLAAAIERNALFSNPERAGQILLWRRDVITSFASIDAVEHAVSAGSGAQAPGPRAETLPRDSGGCCTTVASRTRSAPLFWLLVLIGLWAALVSGKAGHPD